MNTVTLVLLSWLAMTFVMLAFIRGADLQEREAAELDEEFRRDVGPLSTLHQ